MIDSAYGSIPGYKYNISNNVIAAEKQPETGVNGINNGLLNEVFRDKFETAKSILLDILYDLKNRSALDHELMKNINEDICRLQTQLLALESWPTGQDQTVDKKRGALEDKIHELENGLRIQDIKRWQDMVSLKTELRKIFTEYKDLKRKLKIIDYGTKE